MIKETGRVVAVEGQYLWVETINRGTCGSCAAEVGCGQSLLARWLSRSHYLKVGLDGRRSSQFAINDEICIGVPENLVVVSSLLLYCLPLLGLILGATLGQFLFGHDSAAITGGVSGLFAGALVVRIISWQRRNNRGIRPVIVDLIET